jgi:curved DNA-binding protein CbpA
MSLVMDDIAAFRTLGVSPQSSHKEIKAAYKRLVLKTP